MFLLAFLRWLWPFSRPQAPEPVHLREAGDDVKAMTPDDELDYEPVQPAEPADVIYTGLDPSIGTGPKLSCSELLVLAMEKAMLPRSGTVYVHFNPDGSGSVVESSDRFGPDIVIGPVKDFPLRARPVKTASKLMLAIADGKLSPGRCPARELPTEDIERPASLHKKRML